MGHELECAGPLFLKYELHRPPIAHILHHLAKDGIVHEFVKILSNCVFGLFALGSVVVDVGLESPRLVEAENPVHLPQDQAMLEHQLEHVIVDDVVFLVTEVHDQLQSFECPCLHTHPISRKLFSCKITGMRRKLALETERQIVVIHMNFGRIV